MGTGLLSFGGDDAILELDSDDGCTPPWIYLRVLYYRLSWRRCPAHLTFLPPAHSGLHELETWMWLEKSLIRTIKLFYRPMKIDQVEAGGHDFLISLYINSVLRADIEIKLGHKCLFLHGAFLYFYRGKPLIFFFFFYQNIQDKHIYKLNDLRLWYPLLKVQMSFIAVIYPFGFILRTRHYVSKYCLLYSQLWSAPLPCSAWLEINTPKPASIATFCSV